MADRISSNEYSDLDELSGEAVDLVEITGVVKWFDVAKGFGFIVPDNGMSQPPARTVEALYRIEPGAPGRYRPECRCRTDSLKEILRPIYSPG